METKSEQQGDIQIFIVSGVLDASNAHLFERNLAPLISDGIRGIVIDLKGLDYMSSAGIREIIKAKRLLDTHQMTISFCSLQPFLTEVFDMAGLLDHFEIFPDRESALSALI